MPPVVFDRRDLVVDHDGQKWVVLRRLKGSWVMCKRYGEPTGPVATFTPSSLGMFIPMGMSEAGIKPYTARKNKGERSE